MLNTLELQDRMNDPKMKQHLNDPRFKALVQAASSSLREFFEMIQQESAKFPDHAETLVRKARLVLAFRVEEEHSEEHVIDLKTGPMPLIATRPRAGDDPYDMIVSVDTRKRFIGLMTQEEDGMAAYKTGAIRLVKGSMRALLKLRSLQELADRWREDFALSDGAAGPAETTVIFSGASEDERIHQGYLDKQSDWLRKWNTRYVVLKWNEKSRPQLRFFSSQAASRTAPAKHFLELHSGIECKPVFAEPLVFHIIDRRQSGKVLFALRAASERSLHEWIHAFEEAISSRAKALEVARKRLRGESGADAAIAGAAVRNPTGGLLDLLLATQRVCTSHSEQLRLAEEERRRARENILRLETRAQEAEEFLIYSTIESDLTTIRKYLGWKFVPFMALVLFLVRKIAQKNASGIAFLSSAMGNLVWSRILPGFVHRWISPETTGYLSVIGLASVAAKHVTESKSWELARRRSRVHALAIRTIWRMKLSSMKAEWLPPMHATAMWNVEFRTSAELLYHLALELRGLWVKTAQFLGARPDVVPEAALQVLKRLHDAVPATPFSEVKVLVEAELKAPLTKHFSSFEESVLASASIGQVHVAHLLDGTKVVVKAQHPNIERKILQDLKNMETIISWVEMIEPDFEVRPLVDEWSKEVSKELEFDKEAVNMLDVGKNLASDSTIYAALPKPIEGLYSKRTLVMHFVPGAKVNDLDNLRRVSGVDTEEQRSNLAMDICNAFARQLFVDGIFQADAHPGNILVAARDSVDPKAVQYLPPAPADDPNRAIPILLDFGLTKRLPQNKRLAFSRLICAMQSLDIGQLLLSFDEMGLRLKREDPFEDLSELRFAFRETDSATESRAQTLAHIQKAREKYESRPRDQRNPVEAFPSELMLFFRTVFLLRGLCTSLNVRVKYSKTMSTWARRALKEHSQKLAEAAKLTIPRSIGDGLGTRIVARCQEYNAIGVQVHALNFVDENAVLADVCFGRLHDVDFRPVTSETLFPCLSLGQGVAQIVARTILDRHMSLKVKDVWKSFSNPDLTVADLLAGDASKLPFAAASLPSKFSIASMHRWKEHLAFVENLYEEGAPRERAHKSIDDNDDNANGGPTNLPWELSTLAFAWGWAIVGLVQAALASKENEECAYESFFTKKIASQLGGCILARAPESELPLPAPKRGMSKKQEEEVNRARDAHRERVNARYAVLSVDLEKLSGGAVDLDKMMDMQSTSEIPNAGAAPGGFDVGAILRSLGPSFKGKEYFVDPRIMNTISARSSMSPSCNLLSTAKALTQLLAAVGSDGKIGSEQAIPATVTDHFSKTLIASSAQPMMEPLGESLGMKVFEFKSLETGELVRGFGQVAFGGSMTMCIPSAGVALSILVNDLTLDRDCSRSILEDILTHQGLRMVSEV